MIPLRVDPRLPAPNRSGCSCSGSGIWGSSRSAPLAAVGRVAADQVTLVTLDVPGTRRSPAFTPAIPKSSSRSRRAVAQPPLSPPPIAVPRHETVARCRFAAVKAQGC